MHRLTLLLLLFAFPAPALAQAFSIDEFDPFYKGRKAVAASWKEAVTALEAMPEARHLRAWAIGERYRAEWVATSITGNYGYRTTLERQFQAELKAAREAPATSDTAAAIATCEAGLLWVQADRFIGTYPRDDKARAAWVAKHNKLAQPHLAALTARGRVLGTAVRAKEADVLMMAHALWERQYYDVVHLSPTRELKNQTPTFEQQQIALYEGHAEQWTRFLTMLDEVKPSRADLARLIGRARENEIKYELVEMLRVEGKLTDAEEQRQKYATQGLKLRQEALALAARGLADQSLDATGCYLAVNLTALNGYRSMYRDLTVEQCTAANAEAQKLATALGEGEPNAYSAALARALRGSLEVELQILQFQQKDEAEEKKRDVDEG